MQPPPLINKRQVIRCKECNDLIMVFRFKMIYGDRLAAHRIDQTQGQAPWNSLMIMKCKHCGMPFTATECVDEEIKK